MPFEGESVVAVDQRDCDDSWTPAAARVKTVVLLVFNLQANGPLEDAHDSESQRCGYGMIIIFDAEERFGFVYRCNGRWEQSVSRHGRAAGVDFDLS